MVELAWGGPKKRRVRITIIEKVEDLFEIEETDDLAPPELAGENLVSDPAPAWLRTAILERDGHRCVLCGATKGLHVHHIFPRAFGGKHKPDNLVTLCVKCHRAIETGDVGKAVFGCVKQAIENRPQPKQVRQRKRRNADRRD